MTYLIDGYNMMHAIGLVRQGLPAGGLERARLRFLNWLASSVAGRSVTVRVVFDAVNGIAQSAESDHRGIRVVYSFHQTADDLIEELIARATDKKQLTIVSNDSRLHLAAHRARSGALRCEEFVDWLIEVPNTSRVPPPEPEEEKPDGGATSAEIAALLHVFAVPKRKKR